MNFRDLRADEIECRVATVKNNGCSLLLYKDARCDMNILDETLGITGWKRHHELINGNLFCTVEVYDEKKEEWISKQDVGTESYTEKEKGQASDSFKRACFNLGVGRELYTAPFIWIDAQNAKIENKGNRYATYDKFVVDEIEILDKRIVKLVIRNEKINKIVFRWNKQTVEEKKADKEEGSKNNKVNGKQRISVEKQKAFLDFCDENKLDINKILESYNLQDVKDITEAQHAGIIRHFEKYRDKWGAD